MAQDIKETIEVIDFLIGIMEDVADAKADGSVSTFEVIQLAIANAPAAVRAAVGAEELGAELQDLDKEELKVIADKAIELSKAVMKLFGKSDA